MIITLLAIIITSIIIIFTTIVIRLKLKLSKLSRLLKQPAEFKDKIDLKPRFSKEKIPENADCIIIGGGVSGIVAAAMLAKLGKKVVIVEQHGKLGGGYHTFKKEGFIFDSGYHYGAFNDKYFKILKLVCSKEIQFHQY